MSKSVAIIGKGPSVKHSTKELIDSFDDVAICNFPPMEKYQHLISNRATYHFLNAGDPFPYNRDFLNSLGLTHVFNIAHEEVSPDRLFLPDHEVYYFSDYGVHVKKEYESKHGFWPSCGVQAFDYFLKNEEYDKICLIGFDFVKPGLPVYYFPKEEVKPALHYLWNNFHYTTNGLALEKSYNSHGGDKQKQFVIDTINASEKQIILYKSEAFDGCTIEKK